MLGCLVLLVKYNIINFMSKVNVTVHASFNVVMLTQSVLTKSEPTVVKEAPGLESTQRRLPKCILI